MHQENDDGSMRSFTDLWTFAGDSRLPELFRRITDAIDIGMLLVDAKSHVILDANRAACELFQGPKEALTGRICHEFVCPNLQGGPITEKEQKADRKECVLINSSGRHVPIINTVSLIEIADRQCLIASFIDITDSKKTENKLKRSEELFKALIDSSLDAKIAMDHEGRIILFNPAAERMFGRKAGEMIGGPVDPIMPEEYRLDHPGFVKGFMKDGKPDGAIGKTNELPALRADGTRFPVELTLSPGFAGGDKFVLAIIRDASERKKKSDELEQAVKWAEESNLMAVEMASKARTANSAKSSFLAAMSHEIRTPMNGIIGMNSLLLETNLTQEQREMAYVVQSSADSLLEIINEILDFSKIEAGKMDIEAIDFNLWACVEDATDVVAARANAKQIELSCMIGTDVPSRVRGDPVRLRQVLLNITGNAVKFTEQGEVVVEVSPGAEDASGRIPIAFSVRDTGIGIPQDKIESLFEAFMQLDSSTTRKYGGTGLGLTISKKIVTLMGGSLHVASDLGRGSVFSFTIPFMPAQSESDSGSFQVSNLSGKKILVVDDNETNRKILRVRLQSWNCAVETCEGGAAGLEALLSGANKGKPFDAALVDMNMPGMAGEQFGRAVRADPSFSGILLVILTSADRIGDQVKLQEAGFDAYLVKPVKHKKLREALAILSGKPTNQGKREMITERHLVGNSAPARILLAEDNATNRKVALKILEKYEYTVDIACDGMEALEKLEKNDYDAVLMDVQMPRMDGLQATRMIRGPGSKVRNPSVPVIAMTAHALKGDREKCIESGMTGYLTKPVNPSELRRTLKEAIDKSRHDAAGPAASARDSGGALNIWNRKSLLERLDDDEEFVADLLRFFSDEAETRMKDLASAISRKHADEVRLHAHSIKGSAANVEATRLKDAAFALEQAAASNKLDDADALMREIVTRLDEFRKEAGLGA